MESNDLKLFDEKMEKTTSVLSQELAMLRVGRANPKILDRITINYYGTPTPVNQLANVSVPEPRMVMIQPWDMNTLKEIEKAIQMSDIGINPNNDGKSLRLIFPELSEERRRELVKIVKKNGEDARVSIRAIRREAIEYFKAEEKAKNITEDDLKLSEKEVQNLTDKFIEKIDNIVSAKEKEILEV